MKTSSFCITGASSGIGKQLAVDLSNPGVHACLLARNTEKLHEVQKLCEERGAIVHCYSVDVSCQAKMHEVIHDFDNKYPIDLLIANAGIGTAQNRQQNSGDGGFKKIIETNILGIHNTFEPLIEQLKKRQKGHLVIMSSLAGYRGFEKYYIYNATKAYARVFGEGLRLDLQKYNLKVSTIAPGFVKTPLTDLNKFKMPWLLSPEKASKIILKGLKKNKSLIAFPFPLYFFVRLIASLPVWLADFIASKIT